MTSKKMNWKIQRSAMTSFRFMSFATVNDFANSKSAKKSPFALLFCKNVGNRDGVKNVHGWLVALIGDNNQRIGIASSAPI